MTAKWTALFLGCCLIRPMSADPPELVRVVRNVLHTDRGQQYAAAGATVNVLGMSTVSGVDPGWQMEMYDSFASIEGLDQSVVAHRQSDSLDAAEIPSDELLGRVRSLIGVYRPDFSYRADEAVKNFPKARYVLVSVYRVHAGGDAGFDQIVKLRRARTSSINLDRPEIAYEVILGGPAGTYLFISPLPSLAILDDGLARTLPNYAEGVKEAAKQAAAQTDFGQERFLLRVEPGMSYVSDEFAAGDPEFWKAK